VLTPRLGKRFVGALQDALSADVDPRTRGHLTVHHKTLFFEFTKTLPRCPFAHKVRVGDQNARRIFVAL
jgi:hypothetical protein